MVQIMLSIAMLPLIIDPTFIPHRFGIWDFRFKVFCQFNKTDRAQRYNKSEIQNPLSKIAPKSWFNGIKTG
jgi:hypothetical protein